MAFSSLTKHIYSQKNFTFDIVYYIYTCNTHETITLTWSFGVRTSQLDPQ